MQTYAHLYLAELFLAWEMVYAKLLEKIKTRSLQYTYSMVQSPSWEATWFAVSQEIPRISRNPKVHYHTHKSPAPASILG